MAAATHATAPTADDEARLGGRSSRAQPGLGSATASVVAIADLVDAGLMAAGFAGGPRRGTIYQ